MGIINIINIFVGDATALDVVEGVESDDEEVDSSNDMFDSGASSCYSHVLSVRSATMRLFSQQPYPCLSSTTVVVPAVLQQSTLSSSGTSNPTKSSLAPLPCCSFVQCDLVTSAIK